MGTQTFSRMVQVPILLLFSGMGAEVHNLWEVVLHSMLMRREEMFTQEAHDGVGDKMETMEEEGKKKKVIAEVINSSLFMPDLITPYCTCFARCRVCSLQKCPINI